MGVFAWILGRARWSQKRGAKANRWDRASLAPNLRVRRLEERRVLNADAAPVQALVVDAGTSAGDGHADTFVVEQHDNQVRITVNGKEVSNTPLSQLSAINIHGSSDDDVLIAEFKSGEPMAGLNLLFDGKGGNDSLVLNGNASVNGVTHNFGESSTNRVDIESATGTAAISYSNLESVNDSLTADSRTFNFESSGQQITLGDAGKSTDDRSQIEVKNSFDESQLSVVFKNPTHDLTLKTNISSDKPDTITLNGLDHNYQADTRILGSPDDLLMVHGPTDVGGGDLELSAGTIKVASSLTTNHANLDIHATNEISIGTAGAVQDDAGSIRIEAPNIEHDGAIVAHGGLAHLDSGADGTTIVRGSIDVTQSDATKPAGTVHILGSQVGLFDRAQIDASAVVGAGTILTGGDYQGQNSSVRNALNTYVGSRVMIQANAVESGNGGKVIVWANENTRFYGTITARGGAKVGSGGLVETSGKEALEATGTVIASAPAGANGTWLIDPVDVLVNAALATSIELSLDAGTDVLITTNVAGADVGTIQIAAPIAKTAGGTATLTFDATTTITVNAAISSTSGALNVVFIAGGAVDINAAITTNGGSFQSTGTTFNNTGGIITTGAGSVLIDHNSTVTIGDAITSTAGNIDITGSAVAQKDDITTANIGHVFVTATTGNITMDNGTTTTTQTGTITYQANVDVHVRTLKTTNGGAINVTAVTGEITDVSNPAIEVETSGAVLLSGLTGISGPFELSGVTNLTLITNRSFHVSTDAILTDLKVSVKPDTANGLAYDLTDNVPGTSNLVFDVHDSGNDLEVTDVHLKNSGNLNFNVISRSGNVELHSINVGAGAVRVEATVGQITDGTNPEAANITTTGTATLIAVTGIGGAADDDIDTTIGTLVASNSTSGAIVIQETNALIIGGSGVQSAGDVSIDVLAGTLTIGTGAGEDITATGARVTLNAAGSVTEQAGSIIVSNELLLTGAGPFLLTEANDVNKLAGTVTNDVSYRDTNGFSIGIGATGLSAANVTLEAGAAVTQTQAIATANLLLKGAGGYTLDNPANDVNKLAGTVTNDVSYRDTNGFSIGIGATGLSAANVTLEAGAAVTQTQAIATANLLLKGAGGYTLDNPANDVNKLAGTVTNDVSYRDTNGFSIGIGATGLSAANVTLEAGAAVTQTQAIATANLLLKGAGGYTLDNPANDVNKLAGTVTNDVSYRDTNGFSIGIGATGLSAANVTLEAGAAVTQTQAIATANLLLKGAGGYTLDNPANDVNKLAGTVTNDVSYRDTNGFSIGIGATGLSAANVTLEAGAAVTQTQAIAATGLTLLGTGPYTLTNGTNNIAALAGTVMNDVSYRDTNGFSIGIGAIGLTAANVTLQSGAAVTQTQAIATANLELLGTGPYTLTNAANNATKIAANITDTLTYTDVDALTVGTVNATIGITTAGKNVRLQAPELDITGSTVTTTGVTDGNVTFVVDKTLKSAGTVNVGAATLAVFPDTTTRVVEFAAANNASVTEDAFYESGFTSLTAGLVIIGRASQTGDIHIGNDAPLLTFDHNLQVQNSGIGRIFVESDYSSASAGANLTLLSGSGVTLRDLSADTTVTVKLANGALSVTGDVRLEENANVTAGLGITFNNNIDADDALLQDRILTLNSSTTGTISVNGNVGAAQPLAVLTIVQSNGATFSGSVNVTDSAVGLVEIIDTVDAQTVSFQGNLTADSLVVDNAGADKYNVSITGALNTIGGTTTFANSGLVTIGNDATDVTTFVGGVVAVAQTDLGLVKGVTIAGTIAASGASAIRLGDGDTSVRVTANSTIGGSATGLIDLGDVTINNTFTLQVGTGINNPINLDAINAVTSGQANVSVNTLGTVTVAEAVGTTAALAQFSVKAGTMDLQGNVTTTTLVDLLAANTITLHNVLVKAIGAAGTIKLNAPTLAGFDFINVVFETRNNGATGGRISQEAFKPTVLANSDVAITQTPLTQNNRTANIEVRVTDPGGTNFGVEVDWLEGPVFEPNARIQSGTGNAAPTFIPFSHIYNTNPTGNPTADIPMLVHLVTFASNTIQPTVGGAPLVFEQIVVIDVLTLPTLVPAVVVEPTPVKPPNPPAEEARVEVAQPVEAPTQVFVPISSGVASSGEERYYELRIVSFDKNGKLIEDKKAIIRLDNPVLKAIYPFDPSKLPTLFGRLPADRYRIYLIEDGAERLILDFTIQQGQPIEMPEFEDTNTNMDNAATDPFGDEQAAPQVPAAVPAPKENNDEHAPAKSGASDNSGPTKAADAFAERLGKASFLSHGGVVVGAAALAFSASGRWEQSIDRLMERFDRRRRPPSRNRVAKREEQLLETSSFNSTDNSHRGS